MEIDQIRDLIYFAERNVTTWLIFICAKGESRVRLFIIEI
jgi:hypothetical protein